MFSIPVFLTFIKKIDLTRNPNIKLNLQTNGDLFDLKHWEDIANVHNCKVINCIISLDASCEETYNIHRVGGNWIKLLNNLEFEAAASCRFKRPESTSNRYKHIRKYSARQDKDPTNSNNLLGFTD